VAEAVAAQVAAAVVVDVAEAEKECYEKDNHSFNPGFHKHDLAYAGT
jgi:hypothetical protein